MVSSFEFESSPSAFWDDDTTTSNNIYYGNNRNICPCPYRRRRRPYRMISRWLQDSSENGTNETNSTTAPTYEEEEEEELVTWEVVYTCIVLTYMFVALLSDRYGADSVMITALTLFMVSGIITVEEGLEGFANEGLITVLVLFVVADGISKTGALDWYMGKLLGRPKTTQSAQMRLMVPISIVSAFLNNTPVVAVMIPIVQRWAKNIKISVQQLLIPLSFSSILGGTCTLIGTSTNLVVVGLLNERYPNDPAVQIGLFELGQYGVPVAFAGLAYILLATPSLLPGGTGGCCRRLNNKSADDEDYYGAINLDSQEDVLLGARLTPWSPAAGRSVKRSGLRDTGGIYLVSVHRAATGNVHRAVGQDFVLQVGDILFFTGLIEGFGEFCEEHALELLTHTTNSNNTINANVVDGDDKGNGLSLTADGTNGVEQQQQSDPLTSGLITGTSATTVAVNNNNNEGKLQAEETSSSTAIDDSNSFISYKKKPSELTASARIVAGLGTVVEGECEDDENNEVAVPCEVGVTKESLMQADDAERSRSITRMIDLIRGHAREEPTETEDSFAPRGRGRGVHHHHQHQNDLIGAPRVVVANEHELVVVGINAPDRPGLLLDVSKALSRLGMNLRHTEASVVKQRSLSIWRCEMVDSDLPDLEEIWSVLNALLESVGGSQAVKLRGLRVIRAVIPKTSKLIGKSAAEADFRKAYNVGVIAVQKSGKNVALSGVIFGHGDVLVLQASEDSPLLKAPPEDFYKRVNDKDAGTMSRSSSIASFIKNTIIKSISNPSLIDEASVQDVEEGNQAVAEIGVQSGASSDDDDYKLGSSFLHEDEIDVASQEMISDMEIIMAEEEAWKDLHVIFVNNEGRNADEAGGAREFLAAMEIPPKSKLANQTAAESGLDKLAGVYLVSIDRPSGRNQEQGEAKARVKVITRRADGSFNDDLSAADNTLTTAEPIFTAVSPEMPLMAGDVLWYAGSASALGDLRKIPGLVSFESEEVKKMDIQVHDRRLVEAVVARRGPLVGKTVKEVRFRTKFGAACIAVHREGKRIHDHPGKIKLQAGDVLLLEAGPSFIRGNIESDKSFALVAEVKDSVPPRLSLFIPALVITIAMLAVFTAGVASLLVCALVASICMVCLGILSEQEARDAVNWEVFVIIASAFGIGTALENSGVAGAVANFLVSVGEAVGMGDAGLLGAVYFATFLISNVVTNNAAAALLFPIAMDAAEQTGVDRKLMSFCLMLGASASFMSPFGYTTNLLIYGPGGYKYKDFVAIGTPMQLILWILSVALLATASTASSWFYGWISTFLALVLVLLWGTLKRFVTSCTSGGEEDKLKGSGTAEDSP